VFVLATTDPQRVLPTILSRCQRFDFRRIPLDALEQHLTWIAEQESIAIQPEAIHVVAQRSQGGLRDAESLLDQLSLLPPPIEANAVWDLLGAVPEQELLALAQAMTSSEPVALLEATRNLLDRGRDPGAVLQGLAGVLRDLVLMAAAPNRPELTGVSPQFRDQLPDLAKSIGRSRLLQWQAQLRGAEQQLRQSVQPRLWLEVLLLGLLAEPMSPAMATATAPSPVPVTASASVPAPTPAPTPTPTAATAPAPQTPSPAQVKTPELPAVAVSAPTPPTSDTNLPELWQQILGSLELPSTRMLLSQQAQLVRLDANRAVVQVAGNWIGMVQSRASLLEQAVGKALGGSRQLIIEASTGVMPPPAAPPAPVVQPTPTAPSPLETERPQLPTAAVVPAVVDAPKPITPLATNELAPSHPTPPAAAQNPENTNPPTGLDRQAKNLADFFNGQVLEVDSDGIG
jgi:DNA polymerase-3 subunit gamma/tau